MPGARQPLRRSGTFSQITAEDVQLQRQIRASEAECQPFVTRSVEVLKDPAAGNAAAALAVFAGQGGATTEATYDTSPAPDAFSLDKLRDLPDTCRDTAITVRGQRVRLQLNLVKHDKVGDDSVLLRVVTSAGDQRSTNSSLTVQRGTLQLSLGAIGRTPPSTAQLIGLGRRAVAKVDSALGSASSPPTS